MSVLYSSKSHQWKIVDFGIMSSATSNHAITTHASRGTGGYRAPELLPEGAAPGRFTSKVDVWALGCIIFELLTGEQAFSNDFNLYDHYYVRENVSKSISLDGYPRLLEHYLLQTIIELLHKDPNDRPRSSQFAPMFDTYSILLNPAIPISLDDIASHPPYIWLKDFVLNEEWNAALPSLSKVAEWHTEK